MLQNTTSEGAQRSDTDPQISGKSDAVVALASRIASIGHSTPEQVEAVLPSLSREFRARIENCRRDLDGMLARLGPHQDMLDVEWVLDWECGDCAYAIAMLLAGARRVIATDSWFIESLLPEPLRSLPGLVTAKLDIAGVAAALADATVELDLVFSNTVTEHLPDLPSTFGHIRRILRSGGLFFTNHDNYFQPVGSHDHGFLFYGPDRSIVFQGVRCWERDEKCAASADHRGRIQRDLPWTWGPDLEQTRDPADCNHCFYFRRAQPWAHLLNQADFRKYFGNETFLTGRPTSGLNKITLFQLQQMIVEAGMDILAFDRNLVTNEPPAALLDAPHFFSAQELQTCTAIVLARAA